MVPPIIRPDRTSSWKRFASSGKAAETAAARQSNYPAAAVAHVPSVNVEGLSSGYQPAPLSSRNQSPATAGGDRRNRVARKEIKIL